MGRSFRFLRTLGKGAFGAVHLAEVREDDDFVQTLAVKWLHPRWSRSSEYTKRLRDEARLLALLRHQAIVRVHGLTRIDGRLAILMEPIAGADLGRVKSMPPRAALEVTAAVADALDAAWSEIPDGSDAPLHVVHRDIKPSNVMVTRRGAVKVMDFGVARAKFDHREAETRSQQFGTARYMAPERWLDGTADAPSDVFSLGVTLLELIAGQPMTRPRLSREGFAADIAENLAHLDELAEIREVVTDMLAFLPEDRPSAEQVARRCAELADRAEGLDLRGWAREVVPGITNEGVETSLTGTEVREETQSAQQTLDLASLEAPADLLPEPERTPPSPRRGPTLAIGLIGAALVALAVFRWFTPDPPPTELPSAEPELTAPAPTPAPVPTPTPEVAPEPEPAPPPAPVRPAPAPPTPEPEPEPAVTQGMVVFTVAPGWVVEVGEERVTERKAVMLPTGNLSLALVNGDQRRRCDIRVGSARTDVTIDASGGCSQAQ